LHRARAAVRATLAPYFDAAGANERPAPSCPDVTTLFSKQLEGEIGPDLCREMERHLEGCPACRASCDSLKRTLQLCRAAPQAEVPRSVQAAVRRALRELDPR
jgi:RNA polymerase sigma-70 factor (ECF subfamily)